MGKDSLKTHVRLWNGNHEAAGRNVPASDRGHRRTDYVRDYGAEWLTGIRVFALYFASIGSPFGNIYSTINETKLKELTHRAFAIDRFLHFL